MIPCTKIFKGIKTIHNQQKAGLLFVWNITERCNLRCNHCYRDSSLFNGESELSDEKCIQLIDQIKAIDAHMVLLTGGEPLLRKNVFDIVRRCKESGLRVGISTNGTVIDEDVAWKIKISGADYVGISIDGREEFNDEFRGFKGASSLSWTAIERLNNLGVKTGVRFTITDENKNDLLYMLDKALKSGVKRFCLYHLVYSGRGKDVVDIGPHAKRDIMETFFNKARELSSIYEDFEVLTTDNHADGIYLSKMFADDEAVLRCIKAQGGCSAGNRVVYLDSDGNVYPCQFLRDEPLGNVCKRRLSDIWSDKGNEFLNMIRDKERFLTGRCGACKYRGICGGCRARARAHSGSLWAEDPACYLDESEISEGNDIVLSKC
jgi:radical SAM protein with 4Fe4S-binding SPASM domain